MSIINTVPTASANGFRLPVGTDYRRGVVFNSVGAATVFDSTQLLVASGSQPVDPLSRITALTIPNTWVVPTNWLGLTMHRYPGGASIAPDIPYSTVRSHDYQVGGKSLRWHHLETSPGIWNWGLFDQWVNAHKSTKDMIVVLGFTPSFYAGAAPSYAVGREPYGTNTSAAPTDMTKWRDYVQAVIDRLIDTLGALPSRVKIEVWNEPHFVTGFSTYFYSDTASKLAEMQRIAYRVVKAKNANIQVLTPAVSKIESVGRGELVTLLDATAVGMTIGGTDGAGTTLSDWADVLTVHDYTEADTRSLDYGSSVFSNMQLVRGIRDARTIMGKPIWITESGYLDGLKVRKSTRVDRAIRLTLAGVLSGAARVIFYSWDNNDGMGLMDLPTARTKLVELNEFIVGKTLSRVNSFRTGQLAFVFSDGTSYVI